MAGNAIPRTRDDKLYSATLEVLRTATEPVLFTDLRKHKQLVPLLKDQRPTRINEVLDCLERKHQVQVGYSPNGLRLAASIDKPFPGLKEPPTMADGRKKWARRGKNAGKLPEASSTETEAPAAPAEATPPAPAAQVNQSLYIPPNLSLDVMARQFAEGIAAHLADRIVEALNLQLPAQINAVMEQYKANGGKQKEVLPKVIIAGLLPQQAGLMVAEFGKDLDLAFIESNESSNSKRIEQLLQSHDVAYGMTSFMGHPLDGKLRSGAKLYQRVSGGLSSLRENLRAYIEASKQAKQSKH